MKHLILICTNLISIFALAGFGGYGGGSSYGSIETNELSQLLNSKTYSVRVPQIAFSNLNNSTIYVSVDKICRTTNSLVTLQTISIPSVKAATEGLFEIQTVMLQRSLLLNDAEGVVISLNQQIEVYTNVPGKATYENAPIYLGTKIYTIPNCHPKASEEYGTPAHH